MGISINTNVAATRASTYLASNHANLQKVWTDCRAENELPSRQMMPGTRSFDEARVYH